MDCLRYNAAYIILQEESNIYDVIMKVEKMVRMYERIKRRDKVGSDIQQRTLCMLDSTV